MRTVGAAAATSTNWVCDTPIYELQKPLLMPPGKLFGFVCTQFTPTGIENIGYRFYISESGFPFTLNDYYIPALFLTAKLEF